MNKKQPMKKTNGLNRETIARLILLEKKQPLIK